MQPYRIAVRESDLEDLRRRLAATRWPAEIPGAGWDRGVPVAYLRELAEYWRGGYDWRAAEARYNRHDQFTTEIDGATVHFFHVRSADPDAVPLLLTHGWPTSNLEYADLIDALTDPAGHGGGQAFHVVIPAIPGFGFSGPQSGPGWGVERTAAAWKELMARLGYDRYIAHGGDLGTWISLALSAMDAEHVIGAHVSFLITPPPPGGDPAALAALPPGDLARLGKMGDWIANRSGYMKIQATRPQTLAYGLVDSPAGQLAWITEKFYEWTGASKSPEETLTRDQILDNVSAYWFTATGGSSAQIYYEMAGQLPIAPTPPPPAPPLPTPLGVAAFAHDATLPVRAFAELGFPDIVQWSEFDRGGHFAPLEEPQLLVRDLRSFATALLSR